MLDALLGIQSSSPRRRMRRFVHAVAIACTVVAPSVTPQEREALTLAKTISLPDVRGRIDHVDIDIRGARLFVAALGNDSVEVVDLNSGKRIERLNGLNAPQGVLYVPLTGRLFVANGGSGQVDMFVGKPFILAGRAARLDDADNMRFDAARGALYVGYGSALVEIDAATGAIAARIELAGHPESFQLEQHGSRIFANVPQARQIAVIDRDRQAQIATWQLDDLQANFAMALDEPAHRLFIAARNPSALAVYDTESGKRIASVPIGKDADDLFYDAERKQIYVICGEGSVSIVKQRDAERYENVGQLKTAPGARTGFFAPNRSELYVAIPARGSMPAEIRVYVVR